MDSFRKFICPHSRTTDSDQHGYAICLDCGGAIVVRLTRHILDKQLAAVLRYGR
jgi:hypothetical protein